MNIAIIGAGPIGLFTAIRLKDELIDNTYKITIYEKRKRYTRNQVVFLRLDIFDKYPEIKKKIVKYSCYTSIHPSENYQAICISKLETNYNKYYNNDNIETERYNEFIYLRIKHLEKILYEIVKNNKNVKFIYKEINNKIMDKHNIIISCEGKKSFIRNKILESNYKKEKCFNSYGLILTFKAKNNNKFKFQYNNVKRMDEYFHLGEQTMLDSIKKGTIQRGKLKFRQNRIRFFRSKDDNVYIALQLNKDEYETIKNSKKYNDLTTYFKRIIKNYLRFYQCTPKTKLNEENVIVLPFNIHLADQTVKIIDDKIYFLFGDSAHTGSFFSGSNLEWGFESVYNILKQGLKFSLLSKLNYYDNPYKKINIKNIIKTKKKLIKDFLSTCSSLGKYVQNQIKKDAEKTYLPFIIINKIEKKITSTDLHNNIFIHSGEIFDTSSIAYIFEKQEYLYKFTKKEFMYFLHPLVIQKFSHIYECN